MPICAKVYSWSEIIECVDPYTWAYLGIVMTISLSILGAVIGMYITGVTLLSSSIKAP